MQMATFRLERYFAQYEFNVEYLLCSSDCESMSIQDLLALEPDAAERFQHHWLGYTETSGSLALRQAICRLYQAVSPEQVLVHAGAEEAIFLFMHATLEADDHVIVHWPCYQSLSEVARSIGCEVTLWKAREELGWALDLDELKSVLRPHTKAIILNTPHNPTGYLMQRDMYEEVNHLAHENGTTVFSDEVYRESEYQESDRLPAACDLNERAVSLGVMSKTYGLAGLRIGWVATRNRAVLTKMATLKDYTTICNSAPSEFLAELALRHRATLVERSLSIITRNLAILDGFFGRHSDNFAWQRPVAGPIAFPRLIEGDVDRFCDDLVKTTGVLLLPGSLYDHPGNHFRIGYGRDNLPEAIDRVEAFLEERI